MELKLLEDFLALVEHGSFTRAAESRFVTQPAFSRRIRSLEQWLGVELVDRNTYPAQLTSTGREFASDIGQLVRQIYDLRGRIRDHQADSQTLILTTQHSLSISFFPAWLGSVAPLLGEGRIRLDASNLHDSLDLFLAGRCDLLLCYHCADIDPPLAHVDIESLQVGTDRMIPVCAPDTAGRPRYGSATGQQTPLLCYPTASFFGRVLELERVTAQSGWNFRWVCESALAGCLKAMALQGSGVAWLPASLTGTEMETGTLLSLTKALPSADLKIVLYRHRIPRVAAVTAFWNYLQELYS